MDGVCIICNRLWFDDEVCLPKIYTWWDNLRSQLITLDIKIWKVKSLIKFSPSLFDKSMIVPCKERRRTRVTVNTNNQLIPETNDSWNGRQIWHNTNTNWQIIMSRIRIIMTTLWLYEDDEILNTLLRASLYARTLISIHIALLFFLITFPLIIKVRSSAVRDIRICFCREKASQWRSFNYFILLCRRDETLWYDIIRC